MTEMDADVLVVGAGPTGLMLANQLVRRGVRVQIIDRHAGPSLQTRALGVQARTLEIYAKLGIADHALQLGKRGTGATLWAQGRKIGRLPLSERGLDDTPYPYILILGQDDNEKIMGENLGKLGASVRVEYRACRPGAGRGTAQRQPSSWQTAPANPCAWPGLPAVMAREVRCAS